MKTFPGFQCGLRLLFPNYIYLTVLATVIFVYVQNNSQSYMETLVYCLQFFFLLCPSEHIPDLSVRVTLILGTMLTFDPLPSSGKSGSGPHGSAALTNEPWG